MTSEAMLLSLPQSPGARFPLNVPVFQFLAMIFATGAAVLFLAPAPAAGSASGKPLQVSPARQRGFWPAAP